MEDNPLLDQQFQAKLYLMKAEPTMKNRIAAVKIDSQSVKFKGGKKFHCPEHGWNKTHGREDCYKLKAVTASSAPGTEKPHLINDNMLPVSEEGT